VSQTANSTTTNYVLEQAARLPQVLSDGTHTYLYGNGRIAQYGETGPEFFLTDGLGSVRQLADSAGDITLSKNYQPYGEVAFNAGNGTSSYGFTGEMTDPTGLIYLRARLYFPEISRFLSKDPWLGNHVRPLSLNRWAYVESNPVNFIDPTGYIRINEAEYALAYLEDLRSKYQLTILVDWGYQLLPVPVPTPPDPSNGQAGSGCTWKEGDWTINELHTLWLGVSALSDSMGGSHKFRTNTGGITISQNPINARGLTLPHRIKFTNSPTSIDSWTVVHELAHAWDGNFGWVLSKKLEEFTGGYTSIIGSAYKWRIGKCDRNKMLPGCNDAGYFYGGIPPAGSDANFNRFEDFAESVTAYVYPVEAQRKVIVYREMKGYEYLFYSDYTKLPRWNFVNDLIEGIIIP
jgi:RHS repeat-associated protein